MIEYFSLFLIKTALAADDLTELGKIDLPGGKFSSIRDLLLGAVTWILGFCGALAVIAIIYSGYMYMTAGGDPAKAESAKKNLVWAITGIVIIGLSIVIVQAVQSAFTP